MKLLHVMVKTGTYVIVLQSDGVTHRKSDNRWNSSVHMGRLETKLKTLSQVFKSQALCVNFGTHERIQL